MAPKVESPKTATEGSPHEEQGSPKKRRKVNHACIYCRRSHMTCDLERPCQRCVKRSIGHLCHDEPREPPKVSKAGRENGEHASDVLLKQEMLNTSAIRPQLGQQSTESQFLQPVGAPSLPRSAGQSSGFRLGQQDTTDPRSLTTGSIPSATSNALTYGDPAQVPAQGRLQDVPNFPSYMFNAPDITDEYNVLNDFLYNSLLDDNSYLGDPSQPFNHDTSLNNTLTASANKTRPSIVSNTKQEQDPRATPQSPTKDGAQSKGTKAEKDDEKFYMKIADPSGNDTPQERMNKLLQAKYNAGLLKPFNYVQGYARLGKYMESHLQPASRQKILKQLDKFRPKFRERMQSLTDMQLMLVEMWFEQKLMEYDRVFASMAIPSCCWRRTGEIFRGNREMAELIHVPIDQLRDGKLAVHEIMAEKDLVKYWDNFLTIAFDNSQKAMLTTCFLKNPADNATDPEIECCFSFTIRRDSQHNIPSLIVGNFIPQVPRKS